MRRAALLALLILAACEPDGQTTTTDTAPPVLTTMAAVAPATTELPTTQAPAPSTTTTTTTTTEPPNATPEFGLTQVVFGAGAMVIITNWGNASGDLEGYWLCQGIIKKSLPEIELAPGEQALLGLGRIPPPSLTGMAVSLFLGPSIGELDPNAGEIALLTDSSCDVPTSMVAYVQWGEAGNLNSDTAVAAGLWAGGSVEVLDEAPSISTGVFPADSNEAWFADIGG